MPSKWNKRRAGGPRAVPTCEQQATNNMDSAIKIRLMEAVMGQLQQLTARPHSSWSRSTGGEPTTPCQDIPGSSGQCSHAFTGQVWLQNPCLPNCSPLHSDPPPPFFFFFKTCTWLRYGTNTKPFNIRKGWPTISKSWLDWLGRWLTVVCTRCNSGNWGRSVIHFACTVDLTTSVWADYAAVQAQCGNLYGNELTRNLSGNIRPQSSELAEPLWTNSGMKSVITVR